MADVEGLAAFIGSLPDGERHSGFFWAAMTAAEDGVGDDGMKQVEQAGISAGLDSGYVQRTVAEARTRVKGDDGG